MADASKRLVFVADLAGTAVFAVEGALAAIGGGLDFFGVMVLSFATALGGGVIRDVLIGATPPAAIRDWRYGALAFAAGALAFGCYPTARTLPGITLTALDAAGLALFAVAGAEKALDYGIPPFIAILMGTITGVGGGTLRDVLLMEIPAVLRIDIYATAALLGAAIVVAARAVGRRPAVAALAGGAACFTLRLLAVAYHWQLPRAPGV